MTAEFPQANAAACEASVSRIDGGPAVNYRGPTTVFGPPTIQDPGFHIKQEEHECSVVC